MSRLEELIQQYCPDGVEFVSIGNLITRVRNKGGKNPTIKTVYSVSNTLGLVKAEDFRENVIYSEDTSNYIVIEQGMFAYNPARLNIGSLAWLQTNQSGLVSPMYVVFSIDQTKVLPEFLFLHLKSPYVIGKINSLTESGARFRFDFERWKLIEIPIPPIPIQREIVRLLETFSELQSTLQAELQKRLQQYNYYRDNLLSFEGRTDVEWKKLGEVASIKTGTKPDLIMTTQTDFEYINAGTTNSGYTNLANSDGGAITTPSRGQGGIGFVGYQRNPFWLGPLCYKIVSTENKLLTKYLYYYLVCHNDVILKLKNSGGVPALNRQDLVNITIPIPPIMIQQHIISILDRFDTLTNDLSQGLPAEIEARRKQYEYYRDQLLTFEKKA